MTIGIPSLTRRQAFARLGIAAAATIAAPRAFAQAAPETVAALLPGAGVCILSPQAVEGPFYFDPKLERSDITDGHKGVPVRLLLQIVEASDCQPLAGARVDVWHADALGEYSGYDGQGDDRSTSTVGQSFLRGTQLTDAAGQASFATIYPGWYRGRTPHIHFKAFADDQNVVTGQIYFPDALSEFIYTNVGPYDTRATGRDTTNATDGVLKRSGGGHETFCNIKEESDRYLASLIIGVDRDATAGPVQRPAGPPPGAEGGPAPDGSAPVSGAKGSLVPGVAETE